ncbi:hypothetical protein JW879_00745 [candidate division WOR-3 bacterium]|nr:hypothetical protein [candidate division WOR-3 bacterium]
MRRRKLVGLIVIFVIFVVFGCETNPTGSDISTDEEADKKAIQDFISNDADFAGYFAFDEYYGLGDTMPLEIPLRTITNPHTWYREPQDVNRDMSINIVNDSAFVSFWNRVDGVFHVLEKDISASSGALIDHQKKLIDVSHNYAIFKRYAGVSAYGGYRLESLTGIGVSGAEVQPSDCVWVRIDSLRINCESYEDTLFTSPLVFFHREELLTFNGQEVVTLTIYSSSSPYYHIYAYLHANSLGHLRRWRLEEIETGVWQGYWVTPLISGIRSIAFDIVEKETIDEEEWRYLSSIWLLPYKIE